MKDKIFNKLKNRNMKKIVLVLISFFVSTSLFGQVGVTEHLDSLMIKYPGGNLQKDMNNIKFYVVNSSDLNSYVVFTLDSTDHCVIGAVKPYTRKIYRVWIKELKEGWNKIHRKTWSLNRRDGSVMECKIELNSDNRKILLFYLKSN